MKTGVIPKAGLCECLNQHWDNEDFKLFEPDFDTKIELKEKGYSVLYWGSGLKFSDPGTDNRDYAFTELRQTIVLFLAAMNGEL